MRNSETIGFIGLGTMGHHMAANLLGAGYPLYVYDVQPEALTAAVNAGAHAASSPAQVAEHAAVVITMLPNTPELLEVVDGTLGLLSGTPRFRLLIDMSTVAPASARDLDSRLAGLGIGFIDAPVSGGPIGAEKAALTIMAGGTPDAFTSALPIFNALGSTVTHVGPAGSGQTLKLCNQLICGINIQAICEALALARASGIDLEIMRRVLMGGSANSWMLEHLGPTMIGRDPRAGFRIDLMLKDLRLVQDLAFQLTVPLPATTLVTAQYVDARAHGEGANGNQALFTVYDRMTNQCPPGPAAS